MCRTLSLVLAIGIALGGCYAHTYEVAGTTAADAPNLSRWHSRLLFGFVEISDPVELRSVCPQGIARIESQVTFLAALAGLGTLFIYAPSSEKVFCQVDDDRQQAGDGSVRIAPVMPGPVDE